MGSVRPLGCFRIRSILFARTSSEDPAANWIANANRECASGAAEKSQPSLWLTTATTSQQNYPPTLIIPTLTSSNTGAPYWVPGGRALPSLSVFSSEGVTKQTRRRPGPLMATGATMPSRAILAPAQVPVQGCGCDRTEWPQLAAIIS